MTATIESGDVAAIAVEPAVTPTSAWLARRRERWGCSEVPVLLAARGVIPVASLPQYLRDELAAGRGGVERYLLRKAGIRRPIAMSGRARFAALERRLVDTWARVYADDYLVERVQHASAFPGQLWPIRDRGSDDLACSLDAWAVSIFDARIVPVEAKCPPTSDAWAAYGPRYTAQIQAELACLDAEQGLCVIGERWAIPGMDGPIRTHAVERDEAMIGRIREVCAESWQVVERLRAQRERQG